MVSSRVGTLCCNCGPRYEVEGLVLLGTTGQVLWSVNNEWVGFHLGFLVLVRPPAAEYSAGVEVTL